MANKESQNDNVYTIPADSFIREGMTFIYLPIAIGNPGFPLMYFPVLETDRLKDIKKRLKICSKGDFVVTSKVEPDEELSPNLITKLENGTVKLMSFSTDVMDHEAIKIPIKKNKNS